MGSIVLLAKFTQSEHPSLNESAVMPDMYLGNVKKYIKHHENDRAIFYLTKAINTMRLIEADVDVDGGEHIEAAITELEELRQLMEFDLVEIDYLNEKIDMALSALSYVELRVSIDYVESNDPHKAIKALEYADFHLKRALDFSRGELHERELRIHYEIDSLLKLDAFSHDVAIEIDQLVDEINELLDDM
jgi:hypothetical protein